MIITANERMLNYYPEVIKRVLEFQALIGGESIEVDDIKNDISILVDEAYLLTMGEDRIAEWEKALSIPLNEENSLEDRRAVIIARIRAQGKLNTATINSIVNAFTGGTATSYFKDSTIHVEITPPPGNKQYKFENVERELLKKKPAHLGLKVTRHYATWGEVKDSYASWKAISRLNNWEDLLLWINPSADSEGVRSSDGRTLFGIDGKQISVTDGYASEYSASTINECIREAETLSGN